MNIRRPMIVVGAAAAAMMATAAFAQDRAFNIYASNVGILQFVEVQKELSVTEAQRTKLNGVATWFNAEAKKLREAVKPGAQPTQADITKQNKLLADMKTKCLNVLTEGQLKRLREVSLQQAGISGLLDDKISKQIGLSAAQLKTLRDGFSANAKKGADLNQKTLKPIMDKYEKLAKGKSQAEQKKLSEQMQKEMAAAQKKLQPQFDAMAKQYQALIEKTVTKKQQDAHKALLGKPFKPTTATKR